MTSWTFAASSDLSGGVTSLSSGSGHWTPTSDDTSQYLEIDFGTTLTLKSLRASSPWNAGTFVRDYRVEYSLDGTTWQHLMQRDNST